MSSPLLIPIMFDMGFRRFSPHIDSLLAMTMRHVGMVRYLLMTFRFTDPWKPRTRNGNIYAVSIPQEIVMASVDSGESSVGDQLTLHLAPAPAIELLSAAVNRIPPACDNLIRASRT